MRLHVDKEADALYLRLDDSKIIESDEVAPGILVDYDADGTVTGVEILDVSERKDALQEIGFRSSQLMAELLQTSTNDPRVTTFCSGATSLLLIGWATGGIFFGVLGDRIGRVKTLTVMILCYSLSTGFCGLSQGPWDYCFWCFITGLGIGGIFPVGCTLVVYVPPGQKDSD